MTKLENQVSACGPGRPQTDLMLMVNRCTSRVARAFLRRHRQNATQGQNCHGAEAGNPHHQQSAASRRKWTERGKEQALSMSEAKNPSKLADPQLQPATGCACTSRSLPSLVIIRARAGDLRCKIGSICMAISKDVRREACLDSEIQLV